MDVLCITQDETDCLAACTCLLQSKTPKHILTALFLLRHWLQLELASEEIDHLLKRGAYDVFQDDDREGKDFVEANIDDIMKRAATKVFLCWIDFPAKLALGDYSPPPLLKLLLHAEFYLRIL